MSDPGGLAATNVDDDSSLANGDALALDGDEALLHGVETRTSAPVQIVRDGATCECVGLASLFPAGEGAGYAGGIVSAAVDGMRVGEALLDVLLESALPSGAATTSETAAEH